jgi:hypothetical protein
MKRVLEALKILDEKENNTSNYRINLWGDGCGFVDCDTLDIFEFGDLNELRDWAEGVILQDSNSLKLSRKGKKELDKEVEE